ncbi:iron chelate uptake ABC transporter family permease subunit [Pseudomonas sp. Fl5BN2]|uniref:iron chelate uptake ABC transporter family permease subunit n=1 Tax=Pseudomonas sp. Fl5BN2 TaxID=2697652 RepID=UPI0013783DE2|nr:iron chelate uptake ABC transporter family permease subunit [Pseudomonas sp. Fl5BN2]NBF04305.1 iron chelate uptake ABC transporter family permease subunit [Pseudomonas sp. Fl5BN2]
MNRALIHSGVWLLVIVLALAFVLLGADFDFDYVIPKRLARLGAICLGGVCVAWSSLVFQSITGNRILTPAIMGYEAVYLLLQALLILLLGSGSLALLGPNGNVLISLLCMFGYSWALHRWLLRDARSNLYFLLLFGLVLSVVLGTFTQFIQLSISPGEFSVLQGFSYTSFNRIQPQQLLYSAVLVALVGLLGLKTLASLDVLALGRDQALSLGVDYRRYVRLYLALIAVLVAVSTSLLGPTAFMGIFVANLTYALAGTSRHRLTLPMGSALAIAMFIIAQFLVEQVFNYKTTVGILVNLVCGGYFLALMIRSRGRT